MKSQKKIMPWTAALCFIMLTLTGLKAQTRTVAPSSAQGFAVLELFTSEGCSSCPPAEALLEKIARASVNKPVYVLAYHVDYWDHQGWKDTFSDHRFSTRQYDYSRFFSGRVYTPQLVVNGTTEGIGADQGFVNGAINQALAEKATATLQVDVQSEKGVGFLSYKIHGTTGPVKLMVAVVQRRAVSKVTRGENAGRVLIHAAIVRDLQTLSVGSHTNGRLNIKLPVYFDRKADDIVSFLQNPRTGRIIAAGRANII